MLYLIYAPPKWPHLLSWAHLRVGRHFCLSYSPFLKTYVQLVAVPWDYTVVACWPGYASQSSANTEGWGQAMSNGAGAPRTEGAAANKGGAQISDFWLPETWPGAMV